MDQNAIFPELQVGGARLRRIQSHRYRCHGRDYTGLGVIPLRPRRYDVLLDSLWPAAMVA